MVSVNTGTEFPGAKCFSDIATQQLKVNQFAYKVGLCTYLLQQLFSESARLIEKYCNFAYRFLTSQVIGTNLSMRGSAL